MRTLHLGLRVADPQRSRDFYRALGYEVVGTVAGTPIGDLTMLKLPEDPFVSLELVHDPARRAVIAGAGLSHLVVQVESLDGTVATLATRGIDADAPEPPAGPGDIRVASITDPDGNRVELVQWPPGHPAGMTAADWDDGADR